MDPKSKSATESAQEIMERAWPYLEAMREGHQVYARIPEDSTGDWRRVLSPSVLFCRGMEFKVVKQPRRIWVKFDNHGNVAKVCEHAAPLDSTFVEMIEATTE